MNRTTALVAIAALAAVAVPSPAVANDDDVIRRGGCSGSAEWKLKASPEDGRIEVEGEVDSNRIGQTWRWRLVHNGSVTARGTAKTVGPSGSFDVRRVVVDLKGDDTLRFRARHISSGQRCNGSLTF